jgi:dolichol-phosphate mannosyltransferase
MPALRPEAFDGRLSVVVPVRNEAENIEPLVREIVAALAPLRAFEIVYVDDGSDDATAAELARLRAEVGALRFVRHPASLVPRGREVALVQGFSE